MGIQKVQPIHPTGTATSGIPYPTQQGTKKEDSTDGTFASVLEQVIKGREE